MAGPTRKPSGGEVSFVEGIKRVPLSISGGTHFNSVFGNNNNLGSRSLPHDQVTSYIRIPCPPVGSDWVTGTDVTLRVIYTLFTSGGAAEQVHTELRYAMINEGQVIPSNYDGSVTKVIDLEGVSWDTLWTEDYTIPAADVVADADYMTFEIRRRTGEVVTEYPNSWVIHQLELRYQARGLDLD